MDRSPAFTLHRASGRVPVLLSVPHAGRDYSPAVLAAARVARAVLAQLEDPLVDRLAERAIAAGAGAVVAHRPRAEIDLNRSLDDLDPAMVEWAERRAGPASRRAQSGLGLIPARLGGHGNLWNAPLRAGEVERRVADIYRPYHSAIARELEALRRAFGVAVLLDCHSMPRCCAADVVIGDLHGSSAAGELADAVERAAVAAGFAAARNAPYAGGEIVARHGRPLAGIHALQIEIARDCYLAPDGRSPGDGFERVARLIEACVEELAGTALPVEAIAAE